MARKYRCPYCNNTYERPKLIKHIAKVHSEMIPQDYTATRVVFDMINKTDGGRCRVCGAPTDWNESKGHYEVLCNNPKCKEKMREDYKRNMLRVKGTYNILNDPEQQKRMLANRKISGKYKHSDGGIITYTGSYEKEALEFMDVFMQIPSKDILSPGPTIEYTYNGTKHIYIADFLYIPYNLIIEIKDGGDNPNQQQSDSRIASREKMLEKERVITDRGEYNYIRLTNNQFPQLIEVFMDIKLKIMNGETDKTIKINESADSKAINEYFEYPTYVMPELIFEGVNDEWVDLYHGSDRILKTIDPRSYNAGFKKDEIKFSSFWFPKMEYAIAFSAYSLFNHNPNMPKDYQGWATIDNDMKCIVPNFREFINAAKIAMRKSVYTYVYMTRASIYDIGYGHTMNFPEYTIDHPVVPTKTYKIPMDQMLKYVKFVGHDYYYKVNDMYAKGKMTYTANPIQKQLNKHLYYNSLGNVNTSINAKMALMTMESGEVIKLNIEED